MLWYVTNVNDSSTYKVQFEHQARSMYHGLPLTRSFLSLLIGLISRNAHLELPLQLYFVGGSELVSKGADPEGKRALSRLWQAGRYSS